MKNRLRIAITLALQLSLALAPAASHAGTVVLKRAFVEKYKNRATADIEFIIDHAHKKPNAISSDGQDGDLHSSGRAPNEVGLPMVAEVMNAKSQTAGVNLIRQNEGKNQPIPLSGAWRIWFEHPSATDQIQGQPVPVPKDTNPAHVFEVHPITQLQTTSVLSAFQSIPGYQAYDAGTAFSSYESMTVTVRANSSAIGIKAPKAGYNYAEFVMELQGPPQQVADGVLVLATVLDTEGSTVVGQLRRMVFVAGTEPATKVKGLKKGDRLHVLGIPRVNLERIAYLASQNGQNPVTTKLPYEMIIVGALPD